MQMKNLLRLMGALALTTVATTSVVACGDQTAKQDIKDVKVDDLKTAVDSEKTFGDLNTNKEITDAVAAAIKKTTKLDVSVGTDFTLTNDKKKEDKQVACEVKFTVTAQGDKISGTFTFTDTLTVAKQDIKDVKVDDLKTAVDSEKTFGDLNTNKEITDAVAAAIKKTTKLDVSVGTDFTLTNDKKKEDKQVAGEVKFTVTAQGDKISGTFTFTDTLTVAKQDIKDVKVDDLKTAVDSEKTFGDLNTNKEITDAVAAAIKKTTKLDVSVGTDFTLTNDKKKEDKQVAGEVKFTVTAQGDKISGTFTFTDTLTVAKQDIKDVKVDDLKTAVDSEKTFGDLNTNKEITDAVAAAIKKTTKLDVSVGTDFTLTNDKKKEDKQVAGEVKFTVTAQGDKISGTFTFTDTLTVAKQDIKDVKVDDLKTAVDSEKTFGDLNTNKEITDAVAAAIKKTTKLDVSVGTDFTLTNDKKKEDKQVAGEVKFTVTAQGDKISGTFTFTDTLTVAKQDIKDVKVDDLKTAVDSEKTFGDLNTNKEITDAVAAAIKKTTKLDVSVGTDFTLTNDKKKEDKQVAGEVKFTVTAQGDKISGTFTFTDTIE